MSNFRGILGRVYCWKESFIFWRILRYGRPSASRTENLKIASFPETDAPKTAQRGHQPCLSMN